MKNILRTSTAILVTIFLVSCGGAPESSTKPAQNDDDHHQGETNVEPHGHDGQSSSAVDHHEGEENVASHGHEDENTKLPPSRSRLDAANDDHHAGEENVAPHGH